ncbi:hypothetical protein BJY01DRAFT_241485 [Aspergillus pseudoustus]|uniref:(S)-ureidoglycine aminohydrolase cupin domain-containing protein n=1 Tax=Aspergillus pseudoustus TaxID=1810923 RepID=A0ABR4IDN9_9EURO
MVLQVKRKTELFKVPNYGGIPNVYFADILGTQQPPDALPKQPTPATSAANPIVGSWFRMESGPEATPPRYEYDEVGVVLEGEITLRDESGQTTTVTPGDVFFFPRGSTISFSSKTYGVAWKCGARIAEVARL